MFNNHTACRLYRIMVMATSVMGLMKMRNIAPRVGIEPTSLAFQANVLTVTQPRLHDDIALTIPTYLCSCLPERTVHTTIVISGSLQNESMVRMMLGAVI